jgi:hypothetical protein
MKRLVTNDNVKMYYVSLKVLSGIENYTLSVKNMQTARVHNQTCFYEDSQYNAAFA